MIQVGQSKNVSGFLSKNAMKKYDKIAIILLKILKTFTIYGKI